jgi:hypothetical protein
MKQLLKQSMPPIDRDAAQERDLWPAMLLRMNAKSAASPQSLPIWFDWAVLAGLIAVIAVFPSSIPLLLYYL